MAKKYRIKCPSCGNVTNVAGNGPCPSCKAPLSVDQPASFTLYRQGNFFGAANAFSIYLNNEPYGQIGNRECLTFPLPYGEYLVHITCGMNRNCNDPVLKLTPENPSACMKVHMRPGAFRSTFILEPADPSTMPQ